MIKINTKIIKGLNPCESRFNNYLSYYKDFDGTLEEFLALDNITYSDKTWVFVRLANKSQLLKWSYLCAESVLHIFETKYPNDNRPRQALDAKLKYINKPTKDNLIDWDNSRNDAAAAAYAATAAYAAATYAADAYAAIAAYNSAATSATDADAAAAYAAYNAAAVAAYAAYNATAAAAATRESQQDLNLLFMIEAVS